MLKYSNFISPRILSPFQTSEATLDGVQEFMDYGEGLSKQH